MKIEEATQTKDGTPVCIYTTNGGGKYPVHGAIWDEIQWVVRGSARGWIGTWKKPNKGADTWWIRDVTKSWSLSGVKMPTGPADWREAIAKRPET